MRAHTDFLTTLAKVHHDHAEKQPLLGSRSSFIVSFLFAILAVLIERNEPSNEPLLARSPGCSGKILRRARRGVACFAFLDFLIIPFTVFFVVVRVVGCGGAMSA